MLDSHPTVCSNLNRFERYRDSFIFVAGGVGNLASRCILKARHRRRSMNDIAVITLSCGHGFAIVDAEDFAALNSYTWSKIWCGYVRRNSRHNKKQTHFLMHRQIMNAPLGLDVDHINGCRFDNRRSNLRLCTRRQNLCHSTRLNRRNTSGVNGVSFERRRGKWTARIHVAGKYLFLGYFQEKERAIEARRSAAVRYHGDFASTV